MILEWPCRYDGCDETLNDKDNYITTKYCGKHKLLMEKQRRKKLNEKKSTLRSLLRLRRCSVCKKQLSMNQSKFCSVRCMKQRQKETRQQERYIKSIQYHNRKIQELVRKLK
jgi:hypothetical protein